jgi:hypothetical protein
MGWFSGGFAVGVKTPLKVAEWALSPITGFVKNNLSDQAIGGAFKGAGKNGSGVFGALKTHKVATGVVAATALAGGAFALLRDNERDASQAAIDARVTQLMGAHAAMQAGAMPGVQVSGAQHQGMMIDPHMVAQAR